MASLCLAGIGYSMGSLGSPSHGLSCWLTQVHSYGGLRVPGEATGRWMDLSMQTLFRPLLLPYLPLFYDSTVAQISEVGK